MCCEDEENIGSFGWWIYPDGYLDEINIRGNHGLTAHVWLSDHNYNQIDYDEAIEDLKMLGAIRIATFHGSDEMNINFIPDNVTLASLKSLTHFLKDTRSDFTRYWFDTGSPKFHSVTLRQALNILKETIISKEEAPSSCLKF